MRFSTFSRTFFTPWDFSKRMPKLSSWDSIMQANRLCWLCSRLEGLPSWTQPNTLSPKVLRLTTSILRPLTWVDIRPWGKSGENILLIYRELSMWSIVLIRRGSRRVRRSSRPFCNLRNWLRFLLLYWVIRLIRGKLFRKRNWSRFSGWPSRPSLEVKMLRSCMEDLLSCLCVRLLRRLGLRSLSIG